MATTKNRPIKPTEKAILLIHLSKYYGGSAVRVLQMARMLNQQRRFSVVVLKDSPLHKKLLTENLPTIALTLKRGDPRLIFALKNIIQQQQFHIVDTHNPQSHLWGLLAAKLARINDIITTVHGCYGEAETGWRAFLYDGVLRLNNLANSRFIAVSGTVAVYLKKLAVNENNTQLILNAIAEPPNISPKTTIKQLCHWPDEALIIAIAARLEPVKGINNLIAAFAKSRQQQKQLKLCIIGEGRERSALEQQVHELGLDDSIAFTGFRQDVTDLLKSADIFCLSSLSEGLPYAVLEAALCHLPLVLSEVGGMAELFRHHQTALFYPPQDEDKLMSMLLQLAADAQQREQLATAAYQLVKQSFSPETMFAQVLTLYDKSSSCASLG